MGIVVNPVKAFNYCHGYRNPKTGELILWSEGVVGTLSDEQEKKCKVKKIIGEIPEKLEERYARFSSISMMCSSKVGLKYPKGERLKPFLECMKKELKEGDFK